MNPCVAVEFRSLRERKPSSPSPVYPNLQGKVEQLQLSTMN